MSSEPYWKGRKFLPKHELEDGKYYRGTCRNARVAMWDIRDEVFWYMRDKFGFVYKESICHPEDDGGADLFLPRSEEPNPTPFQVIKPDYVIKEDQDE